MIIFAAIVLSLYGGINFYIFRRGWQATRGWGWVRVVLLAVFILLAFSFILGRFLAGRGVWESKVLVAAGSSYLALMAFLLVLVAFIDLLRLANAFLGFFPRAVRESPQRAASFAFAAVLVLAVGLFVGGWVNARHIRLRAFDIGIDKPGGQFKSLSVILASDIHLGTTVGPRRLETIVAKINGLGPDLVLLAGDIVDEGVSEEAEEKMTALLRTIRAPLGAYAVTGNHEYYAGLEESLSYLRRGGVVVLEDEAVLVEESFFLVGRKDRTENRFGRRRKSLEELLTGLDRGRPVILMDHQPVNLAEAELQGVDLQVSGHTHNGQIIPMTWINKLFYELNWGYKRKGRSQFYVSSGAGTWGPAVRVGSVPEIVLLRLTFGEP
ncbi:MAG: metallophosphoesterase [Candidatus Aminicenantes bacterium]|nr:metallophosphoesterase [Candidatus Aminicenantes bacterium]